MRRIVIARHGNTFAPGEPPRRIGRATDLPLAASGRAQGLALRDHFAAERFDLVLSGPLLRTRETAELIAPGRAAIVDWLAEIDHGPDEGRPEQEVVTRIGEAALAAWDHDGVAPPGWIVDADARIAAWRSFFGQQAAIGEGAALLVTSNGAARFALAALDGNRPPESVRAEPVEALSFLPADNERTPLRQAQGERGSGNSTRREHASDAHAPSASRKLRTGAYGEVALDPAPRLMGWDLRPGDQR